MKDRAMIEPGVARTQWWHPVEGGRVQCDLCPRSCRLKDGQHGFCFIRENRGGELVLSSYGRSTGFAIDPIEKKPLNHFYPGTSALSFGTAGCNLGCRYCQNWDISKSRNTRMLSALASPADIVGEAVRAGCMSIAYTYNDPTIFAEYAMDTAELAREAGVKNVAVTSGYISPEPRAAMYDLMDAVNVDLKAFTEGFYRKLCFAHLDPVLDTLRYLRHETHVWLEITTLLIPGHNDSEEEVRKLAEWIATELGPYVPLHFSAFHPAYKMLDVPPTPPATLTRARHQAKAEGLLHVYTGNVNDPTGQSTYCGTCGEMVIERDGYSVGAWHLDEKSRCKACGTRLVGYFEEERGRRGLTAARRVRV